MNRLMWNGTGLASNPLPTVPNTRPYARGDIWDVDWEPHHGHEQGGRRPTLIISANFVNQGRAGFVIALPLTRTERGVPSHIRVTPPEGGLTATSFILCEQIRTLDLSRFVQRRGAVSPQTLAAVEESLRRLLVL